MRQCTNGSAAKAPVVLRPKRQRVRGQSVGGAAAKASTGPRPKCQYAAGSSAKAPDVSGVREALSSHLSGHPLSFLQRALENGAQEARRM